MSTYIPKNEQILDQLAEVYIKRIMDTLTPENRELVLHNGITIGRRTGRTYRSAVRYLISMLRNRGQWVKLHDHYQASSSGNDALMRTVEKIILEVHLPAVFEIETHKVGKVYECRIKTGNNDGG